MPLGPGVRYRWKTFPSGKKVRLAFKGNQVIETKKPGEPAKLTDKAKAKYGRREEK